MVCGVGTIWGRWGSTCPATATGTRTTTMEDTMPVPKHPALVHQQAVLRGDLEHADDDALTGLDGWGTFSVDEKRFLAVFPWLSFAERRGTIHRGP